MVKDGDFVMIRVVEQLVDATVEQVNGDTAILTVKTGRYKGETFVRNLGEIEPYQE